VISHRPATILWADRILVVDEGAIVDSGKHDQLILRCEAYRRIWQSQDHETPSMSLEAVDGIGSRVGCRAPLLRSSLDNRHREMGRSQTCLITIAVLTGQVVTRARVPRGCRSVLNLQHSYVRCSKRALRKLSVRSKVISNDSLVSRCRLQARMLVQQLTERRRRPFSGSLSRFFQSSTSKAKNAFLLVACTFGRLSLGVLRA